jgi:hypothetical protein
MRLLLATILTITCLASPVWALNPQPLPPGRTWIHAYWSHHYNWAPQRPVAWHGHAWN